MNALDRLIDAVVQTTTGLAHKGKQQAELLALEHKLSRAQRQLGALVYALRRNGTENEPLVARYIDAIADLERQIAVLRADAPAPEEAEDEAAYCPQCGAVVDADALFCPSCGGKL